MPSEWPRRYTPDELDAIAASIAPHKIDARNIERLQEAVEAFQWASLGEDKNSPKQFLSSTNKGRRVQLALIIELCERRAPESEIEIILNGLDVIASQLLGPVGKIDHLKLKKTAELALAKIPKRGPNPKRAPRQFIGDLAKIFLRITRRLPGRSVSDQEQGDFLKFVEAALEPFKDTQWSEADIKEALKLMKRRKPRRKRPTARKK
jgi:hypothetical protein